MTTLLQPIPSALEPSPDFFSPRRTGGRPDLFSPRALNDFYDPRIVIENRETRITGIEDMQAQRRYMPCTILWMGRRGKGKSLSMVTWAYMMLQRFHRKGLTNWGIATNFACVFADFSHPKLVDAVMTYPDWLQRKIVCVDEVGVVAPSRRSMGSANIHFGNFLTQLRKRQCEVMFTTQFPQVLDYQVLLQVDWFIRANTEDGDVIDLEIFDYWGQFTGDDSRKPWPPYRGQSDFEKTIYGASAFWEAYDTTELQLPLWAPEARERYLSQKWEMPSNEGPSDGKDDILEQLAPPPATLEEYLALTVGSQEFNLAAHITAAAKYLKNPSLSRKEFAAWLELRGYAIEKQRSSTLGKRL